jgi:hypothetical protein
MVALAMPHASSSPSQLAMPHATSPSQPSLEGHPVMMSVRMILMMMVMDDDDDDGYDDDDR